MLIEGAGVTCVCAIESTTWFNSRCIKNSVIQWAITRKAIGSINQHTLLKSLIHAEEAGVRQRLWRVVIIIFYNVETTYPQHIYIQYPIEYLPRSLYKKKYPHSKSLKFGEHLKHIRNLDSNKYNLIVSNRRLFWPQYGLLTIREAENPA